jgi:hypothetical protein
MPTIFDIVSRAAWKMGRNFDPFRAKAAELRDQNVFLLICPRKVLVVVHEVVIVSVPALPRIASGHVTGNRDPVVDPELKNEATQTLVFLGCKLPAANINCLQGESHKKNEILFCEGAWVERKKLN